MKDLLVLLAHLLTTIAKLLGPGGAKAIVADSLLMKQQLLIVNRSRQRAPNLTPVDQMLLGFWSLFLSPHHVQRAMGIAQAIDTFKISRHAQETQVSIAVYRAQKRKARAQRPFTGTDRYHRRIEKT